jgi:hypothetical protein
LYSLRKANGCKLVPRLVANPNPILIAEITSKHQTTLLLLPVAIQDLSTKQALTFEEREFATNWTS